MNDANEKLLAEARRRMDAQAQALAAVFAPARAAGLFLGAAVRIMEANGGTAFAVQYLRGLADELERSRPGATAAKN